MNQNPIDVLTPEAAAQQEFNSTHGFGNQFGVAAATDVAYVPSMAQVPYTGTVLALENCVGSDGFHGAGTFFVVTNYMLQPNDPFLPATPSGGANPKLLTPYQRDFFPLPPIRDATLGGPVVQD